MFITELVERILGYKHCFTAEKTCRLRVSVQYYLKAYLGSVSIDSLLHIFIFGIQLELTRKFWCGTNRLL